VLDDHKIILILERYVQLGQEAVCWFADNLNVREEGKEVMKI
jgi:hypothetical protein